MKKFVLFLSLIVFVGMVEAQIASIADINFESVPSGWTISPANYWMADTNLYAGGHTSYHGFVPIGNPGDTVILTSPLFDFRPYGFAFLSFNQICKVSGTDICQIEYRENTMSSSWQAIPRSSYKGSGIYTNAMFHDGSYIDWMPGDSLAVPTNNWWKTETFDISNEVSFAEVQFRFKITKGSVIGTQIYYGWLIDNFKLTASVHPIAPPAVELISNYGDTVQKTGPFEIIAKVAARTYAPILSPKLYYSATYNSITTQDSTIMIAVEGDSIWTANIPQYSFETSVSFTVLGFDSVGNSNSVNGGFYLKRPEASTTGYFIVGTDSLITTNSPITTTAGNSWSRQLYLSNEISQNGLGGTITKLAWHVNSTGMFYNFQECYFKAVDDVAISSNAYEDPISAGATLVWSGDINLMVGWSEITLKTPFILTKGKNLLVYWHNKHNAGVSTKFNCTSTSSYQAIYRSGSTFPTGGTGTLTYNRPNARFYIVGYYNDSNSVSLHEINNPQSNVLVNPSANIPIVVTLKNKGIVNLDSCYIDWTLNGIPQTRHIWRGNLADDFNATDTIGYFSPAANQYDTILAWVSMPNGIYDSTSYDDTILRITYGISGLDMYFLTTYEDSLYSTGPFPIQAHIASRTLASVPSPINLHVKYTVNGINSFDTLLMDSIGNHIYEAIIPQHPFGTDVEYSILLYDSLLNSVSISDRFYIKRREAGKTGYVIVGTDTISYPSPMYMSHRYAWTRQVYLSHEISPSSAGGIITKLAWDYTYGTPYTLANQSCYFRVVDDDNIPLGAYEDPVTAGATLVWSGTISLTKGWSEVNLTTPFILPPDKNLLVYWHNKSNVKVGTSYLFYSTLMNDYKAIAACGDGGFPSGSGGALKFERPNARFYIIGIRNDSNSVALHAIDNLTDTIPVYPSIKIPIIFTIQNKGIANLDSCYIDWTLNGVLQPRFTWKGSIQSDYYASDTIIYSPKPNQRDTIVMWTSLPNGVYDSTSNDDTLIRIVYGMSQLDLAFISNISDTVYNTGPFSVQASIASRTMSPLPGIINLNVKYTYNGIDSYDTLPMTALGNNIYEAIIPQHVFGTDVAYSITLIDSLGNICHIQNQYHIKHPGGNDDSNSVALFEINNPGEGSMVGNNPVIVTIKNKGIKHLDSCLIHWTLNGVLQTPYTYRGHLPEDFNATLTIGNYTQRSNTYDSIKVWVSLPNGVIDPKTSDDTLTITPYGCYGSVSGNFIIGTNPGANAANMNDALFIASKCGVSGNVTLQYQNGTYNENWDFSNLSNIMGSYTLTITSLNGNRDSVMLKPLSGVGIVLNNTNNLIIKDISIDNISSVNYGVHFKGVAKNIEFRNIHFIGNTTATTSTTAYAPIYKASGSGVVDDVRFIGNLIEGGYYGIYFYGGTSTTAYGTNIVMDSNIITNQYYYATYLYYNDFSSFSHNTILSRTTHTSTYWYGICCYSCNFIADGNKIIQRSTAIVYPYLAYIYYAGYYNATVPSMFSNNELIGYSTSTYYGMYLYSTNKLNIYNNSIYMSGTGGVRSIYVYSSTASNYDIKNNIIIMNAGTSGTALYIGGTTTPFTSDYNCLYSNGYIGYFGATRTSLLDWQTATTRDSNSLSINPSFIDVNSSLELSDYSPFIVPRLNDVAVDINDNKRTSYTTMGAYGVALFEGNNLALKSFLSQDEANDIHCFSNYTNIQVIVKNEGTEHYQFNIHNILLSLEVSGAIHFKVDTLIKAGALLAAQNDTFEITKVLPISTSGIYYIKAYLSSSLDTVYNDDTLYTTYSIHKIQLPYDIDFSTVPVEIIQKQVSGNATWAVEPDTGSMPEITPVFGTGRLTFHSESNPGSMAQLIFNGINLLGTHLPKLEFWYAHDNSNPTKRDYLAIKISTDGMNTELLNAVYRYDQTYTSPGWAHYTIDLSAYANEPCVSLILEAFSYGGGNQNIDRIRLSSSPDISLTYLSPQLTDLVACNLTNLSAKMILSNITAQNVDFDLDTSNIHFFISGMDSLYINYPLSGLFRGLENDTITLNQTLDLSRNGVYDIIAYIDAIDNNSMNDTIKKRLLINPDLIIQDVTGIDEKNCKRIGDSVYVSFKIVNMGNLTVNEFPLSLQINGVNVLNDTIYQHMEPGDYIQYAFAEHFVVPVVSDVQPYYFVKIQTELPCDAQPNNNIKSIMACVDVGDVVDLKVLSIDNPLETPCDSGNRAVKVSVTLSNEGTVDIASSVLHVEVDSVGSILASFSEATASILAKSTTEHIFTQTYRVPNFNGNYTVKVFLETIANDKNTSNDTLSVNACAIYNDVSVSDITAVDWYLGQNIPNPAQTMTEIPYAIPVDGMVNVKIMSVSGQVLYQKETQATAGNHSLVLDIDFLSNGIYYYSMEYAGRTIVKKMTVNK